MTDWNEAKPGSHSAAVARDEWGTRLLAELAKFAHEADCAGLFDTPAQAHKGIVQTAMVHLLSCCDLPDDLPTCAEMVRDAFSDAVRNMEGAPKVN
jgi:hypothetical protein